MITYILEGAVKNCTIDFEREGWRGFLAIPNRSFERKGSNLLNEGGAA